MDSLEAIGGFVALLSGVVGLATGYARFSVGGRTVHAGAGFAKVAGDVLHVPPAPAGWRSDPRGSES